MILDGQFQYIPVDYALFKHLVRCHTQSPTTTNIFFFIFHFPAKATLAPIRHILICWLLVFFPYEANHIFEVVHATLTISS